MLVFCFPPKKSRQYIFNFMGDIRICDPNFLFEALELYISSVPSSTGCHTKPREAPWRPRETTEASSRAQVLARKPSPLKTPPGPI